MSHRLVEVFRASFEALQAVHSGHLSLQCGELHAAAVQFDRASEECRSLAHRIAGGIATTEPEYERALASYEAKLGREIDAEDAEIDALRIRVVDLLIDEGWSNVDIAAVVRGFSVVRASVRRVRLRAVRSTDVALV